MRFKLVIIAVLMETLGWAQSPPSSVMSVIYSNITSTSTLDGCDNTPNPCIDNRSQYTRQSDYSSFRAIGSGTWSVEMDWADGSPSGWTSFGSTAVVTNSSPASGIGYGIGPASTTKPYHDYIRLVITGNATIMNYFGTKQSWWSPSVGTISFPITGSQIAVTTASTLTATTGPILVSGTSSGLDISISGNGDSLISTMNGTSGHAIYAYQTTSVGTATMLVNNSGSDPAISTNGSIAITQANAAYGLTVAAAGPGIGITSSGNGNSLVVGMNGTIGHSIVASQTTSSSTATALITNLGTDPALSLSGITTMSASSSYPVLAVTQSGATYGITVSSVGPGISVSSSGNGDSLISTMNGTSGHAIYAYQATSVGTATMLVNNSGSDPALSLSGGLTVNGTAGVSCSGSPTPSFASINGVVTHC